MSFGVHLRNWLFLLVSFALFLPICINYTANHLWINIRYECIIHSYFCKVILEIVDKMTVMWLYMPTLMYCNIPLGSGC